MAVNQQAQDDAVRAALSTTTLTALGGVAAGGCISNGRSYQTDNATVFIKHNTKPEVCQLLVVVVVVNYYLNRGVSSAMLVFLRALIRGTT